MNIKTFRHYPILLQTISFRRSWKLVESYKEISKFTLLKQYIYINVYVSLQIQFAYKSLMYWLMYISSHFQYKLLGINIYFGHKKLVNSWEILGPILSTNIYVQYLSTVNILCLYLLLYIGITHLHLHLHLHLGKIHLHL